ncbi:MAG: hypothetical protein ABIW36_01760 [Terrimesophilobacter sp.]
MRGSLSHARLDVLGSAGAYAILYALLLSGCATAAQTPPKPTTPATATASPQAPSAAPEKPSDIVFTINATARATDGSRVGMTLTAHRPVAYSDPAVADLSRAFLDDCPTDASGAQLTEETLAATGSALMPLTLSSNRPGQTFVAPVQLFLGGPYTTQTVFGAGIVPPADGCTGIYTWMKSGDAHALVDFQTNESVPDVTMWRYAHYGFVVTPESGATIESCTVTITPLGAKADLSDINGWDPSKAATGTSCGIGYSGE